MWRVSARVSTRLIATIPWRRRYCSSDSVARQLLNVGGASWITNPATCGPADSWSSGVTP
jgi:hypothetical protein